MSGFEVFVFFWLFLIIFFVIVGSIYFLTELKERQSELKQLSELTDLKQKGTDQRVTALANSLKIDFEYVEPVKGYWVVKGDKSGGK